MTDERAFDTPVSGRGQRSWLRLFTVAAILLVLLGIVALASRGERGPRGRGAGPPDEFWDYVISAYLTVGGLFLLLIVWALLTQKHPLKARPRRQEVRQIAFFMTVMVALALLASTNPDLFEWLRPGGDESAENGRGGAGTGRAGSDEPQLEAGRESRWRWAPAAVLGTIAVGGTLAYVLLGRREETAESRAEIAESIAEALDDAVAELRAERDPRAAIIAAYARLEALLGAYGVPRRASEAPFEYLGRVLTELETSPGAVFELTDLFERAKFSHHAIDGSMKDDAIDALVAVRDELRASP